MYLGSLKSLNETKKLLLKNQKSILTMIQRKIELSIKELNKLHFNEYDIAYIRKIKLEKLDANV